MCKEIHEDDGVDPRKLRQPGRSRRKRNHKARQVCRRAAKTLDLVLSGATGNDLLRGLRVIEVRPAPNASRLLVTVQADCRAEDFDRDAAQRSLRSWAGRLRTQVAADVSRRKAPVLKLILLGPAVTLRR